MKFSADGLPDGLKLDETTGQITGSLAKAGNYAIILRAQNALGAAQKPFRIVVGDDIVLTPPMGWNSWNCWHSGVDQEKVLQSARAIITAKLDQHGWSYVNIDDAWQGRRGGEFNAIQADPKKFPDMKALCDTVHAMGLKVGIYSTPWVTSYAGRVGGTSENAEGAWDSALSKGVPNKKILPKAIAKYSFAKADALQWAAWGIDYLKYDWAPNELPETKEMAEALRASKRDIVLSLSNNTTGKLFDEIAEISKYANCWRIGGDITDNWSSIKSHGFGQDKWAPFNRPGHWNDPDMFEVGCNGGGTLKRLTADEQYTHISLWCLLSAPLLLGCDLDHLDAFTLNLLTNDEVLDVNQDALGKQATRVVGTATTDVYAKVLEDGSWAVGLFNRGEAQASVTVNWADLKLAGNNQRVRDLWRQKDLGVFPDQFEAPVAPHGVVLIQIRGASAGSRK